MKQPAHCPRLGTFCTSVLSFGRESSVSVSSNRQAVVENLLYLCPPTDKLWSRIFVCVTVLRWTGLIFGRWVDLFSSQRLTFPPLSLFCHGALWSARTSGGFGLQQLTWASCFIVLFRLHFNPQKSFLTGPLVGDRFWPAQAHTASQPDTTSSVDWVRC